MTSFTPDLVLYNGVLQTLDEKHPQAAAVAIQGNTICAVGEDREILSLAGSRTRKINLQKHLLLPGFTDTHIHFYEWALNYESIDFSKSKNFADMENAVKTKSEKLPPGQWILGRGFNESDWPENRMPTKDDLDRQAPENPVCIWRSDYHLAVANSLALQLAGIDAFTPDPEAGIIVRNPDGDPNGILKENAPNLIRKAIPPLSEEQLIINMQKAMSHAHRLGLTGVHDIRLMGGKDGASALRAWQNLRETGKLNIRCHVALPGEMTDRAISLGLQTGFGDDLLKIGYLKFFADGGMGARTAWMAEKYLDAEYGMQLTPIEEIESAVNKAHQAGMACMIHAVGDRANKEVINIFARLEARKTRRYRFPHRIEHMQMILPEDLEALSQLKNVAVSCHPNNMSLDISMIDQCVGARGRYAYALKSILQTGIPLMLGSDTPVADPNPLAGIFSAVTRKRMDNTPAQGWYPAEALSVYEAVRGYTLTPAQVSCLGDQLGSISAGKTADMIVLGRNIFKIDPEDITHTPVEMTIFNGRVVYEG